MNELTYIIWNINPEMFSIPIIERSPRWYGLLFALGFVLGQIVVTWIYTKENKDPKQVDLLTLYLVITTIIGARLGHCLFYDPEYYLSNPIKIFMVWEGGLASHGAAFTIIPGLYIFAKRHKESFLWLLDTIAIVVCLAGACIRLGNFMNSEIIGLPTENNSGVVFVRDAHDILKYRFGDRVDEISFKKREENLEKTPPGKVPITITVKYQDGFVIDESFEKSFYEDDLRRYIMGYQNIRKHLYENPELPLSYSLFKNKDIYYGEVYTYGIPRHPSQLYESFYYFLLFIFLIGLWYYKRHHFNNGFLFSIFFITLWAQRFFVEYLKENQESWESDLPSTLIGQLNMGQILSIPFVIIGIMMFIKTMPKFK